MADIFDVETVIAGLVNDAIYPNGTSQPSIAGINVLTRTGWPERTLIDNAMQSGSALISVFGTKSVRDCTRFERYFQAGTLSAPTLTVDVTDTTITIGGTVTLPQAINVIFNKIGYGYSVLQNDTITTIATAVAALIPGATSIGPVITLTNVISFTARVVTAYTASEELIRVDQVFMIRCWCPNFTVRPIIGQAVLQQMMLNYHITLPDNFSGLVRNDHYFDNDDIQKLILYVRDIYLTVQYPTTLTQSFTTIADPYVNVTLVQSL